MTDNDLNPAVFVYHEQGKPQPLLPFDYTPFKTLELPRGLGKRPLPVQLATVRRMLETMAARQSSSPFGKVTGYEFEWRRNVSIFLNSKAEFVGDPEAHERAEPRNREEDKLTMPRERSGKREYVIGFQDDNFCSLVAEEGEQADDRDLTFARRFYSLASAQAAADEEIANVFEVTRESGQEQLREVKVDLKVAESRPYNGCWRITDRLWAGRSFLATSATETEERIKALAAAGVTSIVSLIDPTDIHLIQHLTELIRDSGAYADNRLEHSFFPVKDGEALSRELTRIGLDVIDAAYLQGMTTFVHCQGGRGRSSSLIGCWIVRHGYSCGQGALDDVMELRCASGALGVAPETESQRQRILGWTRDF